MSEDHPHKSRPIYRYNARCKTCQRWWSVSENEMSAANGTLANQCPCGGTLALVNMESHLASLPKAGK